MDTSKECDEFINDLSYYDAITKGSHRMLNLAWGCLFKKHSHFINRMKGSGINKEEDRKDSEEAYSDAVEKIKNKIKNGKIAVPGPASIATLIYKQCFYELLQKKREQSLRAEKKNRYLSGVTGEKELSEYAAKELENEMKRQRQELEKYIMNLRNSCSDILLKHYYENKTVSDIAGEKNMTKESVSNELYRCRKELKQDLANNNLDKNFWLWL
jgi:RNA polymerase sigma factor (sigma-70 family)